MLSFCFGQVESLIMVLVEKVTLINFSKSSNDFTDILKTVERNSDFLSTMSTML